MLKITVSICNMTSKFLKCTFLILWKKSADLGTETCFLVMDVDLSL